MVHVRAGVYDLDSEQRSYIAKPADGGHDGAIAAMTFDTHNNRVITGGYDRRIKVWSTDGRLLQNFEVKLAIIPLLFATFVTIRRRFPAILTSNSCDPGLCGVGDGPVLRRRDPHPLGLLRLRPPIRVRPALGLQHHGDCAHGG